MRFILVLSYLSIVTCYLTITEKNFHAKACIKDILKSVSTETTVVYVYRKVYGDILPEKLEQPFVTIDIHKKIHRNSKYKIYNEIVILNLDSVSYLKRYLKVLEENGLWNMKSSFRRRYLIVLPSKKVSQLKDIFAYFFKLYIIDVIIMTYDLYGNIKMFTWDPYHPSNKCGTKFNMEKHSNCSLFKLSMNNEIQQFNKCNFTFVTRSTFEKDRKSCRIAYVAWYILDEVSKDINATLSQKGGYYDYVYVGELNVFLSPSKQCESTKSCTHPFEKSVYYWTVPPRKIMNPLEVFKIVFKTHVWISILLTFVLTSVIWWLISWCTGKANFTSALLKIYSLTIFSAMHKVPSILSLRFIFITYVMYAIHIQSIFTSNLVKILTNVHYEPAIETLEQLTESDLPILVVWHFKNIYDNKKRNDTLYMKIVNKTRVLGWYEFFAALYDKSILENSSIFIKSDYLQELALNYNIKLRTISDDTLLADDQAVMGTSIGSYLIQPIRKIVSVFSEAGLTDFKASEFNRGLKKFEYKYKDEINSNVNSSNPKVLSLTNIYKDESNSNVNSSNPKVLSLTNMYPVFVFWGIGLTCATAVFTMEHIWHVMDKRLHNHTQFSIFTSNLVKILTDVHYEPAIETLEQLTESDLPILVAWHFKDIYENKERNDTLYMKIVNKTHVIQWKEYMAALYDNTILENYSIFIKSDLLQEQVLKNKIEVRTISDDTLLADDQAVMGTSIGSYLIQPIRKIVSVLSEAGLTDFKVSDFIEV
ncbi:hypothetical protein FQA39_LY06083 [Lamprigera yunnana]|nr:hypothetical protein FQA39_LY06083 [Lamprigera yunnana]